MLRIIFFLLVISLIGFASNTRYEKETHITLKDKSTFVISADWQFDPEAQKLLSPEGDLTLWLIQTPFTGNVEALSNSLWKKVESQFDYKVRQIFSPPSRDGWEQIHQVAYEVPAKANRSVVSVVHILKGTAYVVLVDGTNAALDKRGPQLQIVAETWRPEGLKKEDLNQNKIKPFSSENAADWNGFIQAAITDLKIPGAQVAIVQNGAVVYQNTFGVKELGKPDKVTENTLFMIGSTTKPLTTLMLSKLVESGKLSWDTPIMSVLPEFELTDKSTTARFLIRHAACACTGMPRRDLEFVFGSKSGSASDTLRQLHSMSPTTGFGETFQYSNPLVAVGGFAGGNVYTPGKDFQAKYEKAMSELVFSPLGMDSTRVTPNKLDTPKLASPHSRGYDSRMTPFAGSLDETMVLPISPAGSIWSNVGDLSKYIAMELRNGKGPNGDVLFSEEQISKRRSPGVKVDDDTTYGLGLFIETNKGIQIIHHGGNTLGFTSDLLFLPNHNVGMVVLTNASGVNGFRSALKQKLLESFLGAEPKSQELIRFSEKVYEEMRKKIREQVSINSKSTQWIGNYVGKYENADLGPVEISLQKTGKFLFSTPRWKSEIGSKKESTGEKLLSLTSVPWSGGTELRVVPKPKKLILDDAQVKYEFIQIK